jgi:hypothetical protein
MAWKKNSDATFTGGSGQMAVIGELLHRKCNAAIPHVDVGTDVFAFRDDREEVARIQVKTASGKPHKDGRGYYAKFVIPITQLKRTKNPAFFYALAVRLEHGLGDFLVISRARLNELRDQGCGSENGAADNLELYIRFRPDERTHAANSAELKVRCGDFDLSNYINAWDTLPPLKPLEPINSEMPHA